MKRAGLQTFVYLSVQKDEIIVLVRCSEAKLRRFADEINSQLELHPESIEKALKDGTMDSESGQWVIAPVEVPDVPRITSIKPFDYLYGKFEVFIGVAVYLCGVWCVWCVCKTSCCCSSFIFLAFCSVSTAIAINLLFKVFRSRCCGHSSIVAMLMLITISSTHNHPNPNPNSNPNTTDNKTDISPTHHHQPPQDRPDMESLYFNIHSLDLEGNTSTTMFKECMRLKLVAQILESPTRFVLILLANKMIFF
jgi:hypothetical protein